MTIKSQYVNKCKDCGKEYQVGDQIDTNGNKSANQKGEMKDHWCIDGKNCQGVMTVTGKAQVQYITTGIDFKKMMDKPQEPTVKELRERYDALKESVRTDEPFKIIGDYIETREACETLGITHPATIGMIWNNRVRDRQR